MYLATYGEALAQLNHLPLHVCTCIYTHIHIQIHIHMYIRIYTPGGMCALEVTYVPCNVGSGTCPIKSFAAAILWDSAGVCICATYHVIASWYNIYVCVIQYSCVCIIQNSCVCVIQHSCVCVTQHSCVCVIQHSYVCIIQYSCVCVIQHSFVCVRRACVCACVRGQRS